MAGEARQLVVVGGGPAGLATAIAARLAGLEVVVVETRRPPVDRACGEGLMPDGRAQLEALGVEVPPGRRATITGVRYLDRGLVAEGRLPRAGWGIRRTVLHRALAERAAGLGAELRWGVRAHGLEGGLLATEAGDLRPRWLIAADGRASPLRRSLGLSRTPPRPRRFGVRRHVALAPWSEAVEVHWGDGAEAYVTPIDPETVGVAILSAGGARFDDLVGRFPTLLARLGGAPAASRDRGAGPLVERSQRVVVGRVLLVGDAAGTVDPITGMGLSLAFAEARAAVAAIVAGDPRLYVRAHRRIVRAPRLLTRLVLELERSAGLRRRVVGALAEGDLFDRFLAQLSGSGGGLFGRDGLLRLGLAALLGHGRPRRPLDPG